MSDAFDKVLNSTVSVWKKGGNGIVDNYGIESQVFTLLLESVPCRIDAGPGKEIVSEAGFGTQTYTVFMRPLLVDNPPVPLNIHHWLQINNSYGNDVAPVSAGGTMLDIKNVKNQSGHHLEIECLLIEP